MSEPPVLRKTKILATVVPACDDVEILTEMIRAGMNVARLNFSHENHESHRKRLARVRAAAEAAGVRVATMLDTKGAEVRTGTIIDDVVLEEGTSFRLLAADVLGDGEALSLIHISEPTRLQ